MSMPVETEPRDSRAAAPAIKAFGIRNYLICLKGILIRERLRFLNQRERFISSLVRPLLWLFIFAAGILCLTFAWVWSNELRNVWQFPINKNLWSSSFVLNCAGWSLLLLAMQPH